MSPKFNHHNTQSYQVTQIASISDLYFFSLRGQTDCMTWWNGQKKNKMV